MIPRRSSASRIRVAVDAVIPASTARSLTRASSRVASACSNAYCDSVSVPLSARLLGGGAARAPHRLGERIEGREERVAVFVDRQRRQRLRLPGRIHENQIIS